MHIFMRIVTCNWWRWYLHITENGLCHKIRLFSKTRNVLFYGNNWPPSKTPASNRVLAVCLVYDVFHNNSQNAPCHAGPENTPADRWRTWQVIADGGWFLVFAHHLFGNRKLYGGRLETNNIVLRLNSTLKCMIVKTFEDKNKRWVT